ncbi:LysM peptidoglycan-binding domain-containing protein [Weissella sp. MSCH1]|uniref:LysM peptidoglycan-binding domain-containing protein n=1 Tax=Weissella sp. MSCH1 TaxID=3383343 RepID=UPI003896E5ED
MSNYNQQKVGSKMEPQNGGAAIWFFATEEGMTKETNVAQNPVEDGSAVSDHVSLSSDTGSITGYLFGDGGSNPDGQNYMEKMYEWQMKGTLLKWYGRRYMNSIVISNLDFKFDSNANAMQATFTWTRVQITKRPSQVAIAVKKPVSPPPPPTPPGVFVIVRPGDTYWGWMMQYGTPLDTLRGWNGWPDRFIPIGVRARVQ